MSYREWRSAVTDRPFPDDQCEECGQQLGEQAHQCKPAKPAKSRSGARLRQVATLTRGLSAALMAEDGGRSAGLVSELIEWSEAVAVARVRKRRPPAKGRLLQCPHCIVCGGPVYHGEGMYALGEMSVHAMHHGGGKCWDTWAALRETFRAFLAWEERDAEQGEAEDE